MKKSVLLFLCFCIHLTLFSQFSESFESGIPANWTIINGGDTNTWQADPPGSGIANTGTNVAEIVFDASLAHDDYLITPQFTVTAGSTDQLSLFYRHRSNAFPEPFDILLSSSGNTSGDFTTVIQAAVTPTEVWQQGLYDLSAYLGQTVYIAFYSNTLDQWELYLDDINLQALPDCPNPTQISANIISPSALELSWSESGSATNWDLYYGPSPLVPPDASTTPTEDNVTSNTDYTISGLGLNNEFYIRADCIAGGGIGQSNWSGPFVLPMNDVCLGALPLTVGTCPSNSVTVDATAATESPEEIISCDAFGNLGVWFTFVAPSTGGIVYNYTAGTATGNPGVVLFDACNGTEIPGTCQNNPASLNRALDLIPGQTYYLLVWFDSGAGTFDICLEEDCGVQAVSTYYSDFCPSSNIILIDIVSLGIAGSVDITNDLNSDSHLNVVEGVYIFNGFTANDVVTITIQESGNPDCIINQVVTIPDATACPPGNDIPIGAIPATVAMPGTGCNGGSALTLDFTTTNTTDSGYDGSCNAQGLDQFFTYTTTTDALYFSSLTPGNPGIVIWENLATTGVELGEEIDCLGTFNDGILSGWSTGDKLVIQIYDFEGTALSDVSFCLEEFTLLPPPTNDECTSPITIQESMDNSCGSAQSSYTYGATVSPDATCGGGQEVWFEYVSGSNPTPLTLETLNYTGPGSYHTSLITIYSGTCPGNLTEEACLWSPLSFTPLPNTTYLISVQLRSDANIGSQGEFEFCIYSCGGNASDDCSSPIMLSESTDESCNNVFIGSTQCSTLDEINNTTQFAPEVWLEFIPTNTNRYIFEASNVGSSGGSVELELYEGNCGSLTQVPLTDILTSGTSYSVMVITRDQFDFGNQEDFELCVYPDCVEPSLPIVTNITSSGAELTWSQMGTATAWDLEIIPTGTMPSGIPNVNATADNPYNWTGGMSETTYDAYLRANCQANGGVGESDWIGPVTFTTAIELDCSLLNMYNHCYDNNDQTTWHWENPNSNGNVLIFFQVGTIQSCCDNIIIYDGFDNTAPILYNGNNGGSLSGLQFYSSGQSLFMEIDSDGSLSCQDGDACCTAQWEWFVVCDGPCELSPTNVSINNISANGAQLNWTSPILDITDMEIVPSGTPRTGTNLILQVSSPYTWNSGEPQTTYDFYLNNTLCDNNNPLHWVGPFTFTTSCSPSLTLDGLNLGDNSGPNNQSDNESSGTITSTQIIDANAIIDYDSATEIQLNPGFETQVGAIFDAFIDGCDMGGGGNN